MARRCTALAAIAVVALWCGGCAYYVSPQTRAAWGDRIASTEARIEKARKELERINEVTHGNQLALNRGLRQLEGESGEADYKFNEDEIKKWHDANVAEYECLLDAELYLRVIRDVVVGGQ